MKCTKRWIKTEPGWRITLSRSFRDRAIGMAAVYLLFFAIFDTPLREPTDLLPPEENLNVAEARAWLDGSLTLPQRLWDSALHQGRIYNVFPPMMTFVSTAVLPFSPDGVPYLLISLLIVWPIPGLAYLLFLKRTDSVLAAVVLACTFVLGTSAYCVLGRAIQGGNVCRLNNAVSQIGLLVFLIDFYGRRRFWLGGAGLMIAGWSRWTLLAYLLPYLWGLWRRTPERRSVNIARWLGVAAILLACPLILNGVKFGNPLNTGYAYIYEGRTDQAAMDVRQDGVFSPKRIPRNAYAMNVGPPGFEVRRGRWRWIHNTTCTGLWWTTPMLLYVFVDARRIWRSRANRPLLAAAAVVFLAILMYHTDGATQRGYNRFSLDFVLPLMALIAPFAMAGKRRYLTVALALWSVCYFRVILF